MRKNHKPSKEFDKKYGTKTFQAYKFPENKTAFQAWNAGKLEERELIKKLTHEHFTPMIGMKLGICDKREILRGMASGFNYMDIFSFTVLGIYASHEKSLILKKLFWNELKKSKGKEFADKVEKDIHWVISAPTAMHILIMLIDNFDAKSFLNKIRLKLINKPAAKKIN